MAMKFSVIFLSKTVLLFKAMKFFQKSHCIHLLFMIMYFYYMDQPRNWIVVSEPFNNLEGKEMRYEHLR